MRRFLMLAALAAFAAGLAPALAQIKPASSGEPSFREPEMTRHGSGFTRPNRPHRRARLHHRYQRPRARL